MSRALSAGCQVFIFLAKLVKAGRMAKEFVLFFLFFRFVRQQYMGHVLSVQGPCTAARRVKWKVQDA